MIKRIHWTDAEWLAVARELYRQHPIDQYLRSTTLAGLELRDFYDAQVVLPVERRRIKAVKTTTVVKPNLLVAFNKLREEIDAAAKQAEEDKKLAAETEAAEAVIAAAPIPSQLNQYEVIFAPLVELLANAVAARVHAMIGAAMPAPELPNLSSNILQQISSTAPVAVEKSRKLKFGVVGPLSVQAQEIARAFPSIDFVFVESGNKLESSLEKVSGCDKVIGMVDFMSHSAGHNLKKRFGDNYHRTNGNSSRAKHLISVILNSMKHESKV